MTDNVQKLNRLVAQSGKLSQESVARVIVACTLLLCEKLDALIRIARGEDDGEVPGEDVRGRVVPQEPRP